MKDIKRTLLDYTSLFFFPQCSIVYTPTIMGQLTSNVNTMKMPNEKAFYPACATQISQARHRGWRARRINVC